MTLISAQIHQNTYGELSHQLHPEFFLNSILYLFKTTTIAYHSFDAVNVSSQNMTVASVAEQRGTSSQSRAYFQSHIGLSNNAISRKITIF